MPFQNYNRPLHKAISHRGFYSKGKVDEIVRIADQSDYETCLDLQNNVVNTEDDYTSSMLTRIRDKICKSSTLNMGVTITSKRLPPSEERKLGTDGIFIFKNNKRGYAVLCLFEAKWPRLEKPKTVSWDSFQNKNVPARKMSHFHSQLLRQEPYAAKVMVWEMFYGYETKENYMKKNQSACMQFGELKGHIAARNKLDLWTTSELKLLLHKPSLTIGEILRKALYVVTQPMSIDDAESFAKDYGPVSNFCVVEEY